MSETSDESGQVKTPMAWDRQPAADVRDREMRYWLCRAEATFMQSPQLSRDMVRAIGIEMGALARSTSLFARGSAQVLGFLLTAAAAVNMAVFSGVARWLTSSSIPAIGVLLACAAITLMVLVFWHSNIRPMITGLFAHRAVVARDRLHRWLVAAPADADRAGIWGSRQTGSQTRAGGVRDRG